ncbi:MAG: NAD(P)-dependent dehydrogenase (short-subunit alcohol dehydrogenase family) [Arenicella sp.]|jgi:NAD(P)-dependent dehydrogenase (short-subunit alcohol dehydrogenase family)
MFDFEKTPNQKGRIALITGANTGLGLETTKWFVQKEIKVVMACRNLSKAEEAKKSVLSEHPNAEIELMELDLNSLESVKGFAAAFIEKHDKLDLLINNAGVMIPPYSKTKDGFELQFGVNHLGHFLLTDLLLPLINKTEGSRIVSLSSVAHKSGRINLDDINWEKKYSKMKAYGQSKLANLMFALDLNEKIQEKGIKTLSVAAHPGGSNTDLVRHIPKLLYYVLLPLFSLMSHSPKNAALPIVMAALDASVKGGEYFGPQSRTEMKGNPGRAKIESHAKDMEVRKKLWAISEKMVGQPFNV